MVSSDCWSSFSYFTNPCGYSVNSDLRTCLPADGWRRNCAMDERNDGNTMARVLGGFCFWDAFGAYEFVFGTVLQALDCGIDHSDSHWSTQLPSDSDYVDYVVGDLVANVQVCGFMSVEKIDPSEPLSWEDASDCNNGPSVGWDCWRRWLGIPLSRSWTVVEVVLSWLCLIWGAAHKEHVESKWL